MTQLVKYDAAVRALAEAVAVDEVKDIRDRAEAMRIYGMQAKNKDLEIDAAEIRIRAERRLGELIALQKETTGLATGAAGIGKPESAVPDEYRTQPPTLAEAGIDKKLSSRAQKIAAVPIQEFERQLDDWRDRVRNEGERVTVNLERAGERIINGAAAADREQKKLDEIGKLKAEIEELKATIAEQKETIDDLTDSLESQEDAKLDEDAQQVKFAQLREQIRVLNSQVREWQGIANQWKRECLALRRRVGEAA